MSGRALLDGLAGRGVSATLLREETALTKVEFEFSRLKSLEDTESLSSTLQVLRGGRLGVARSSKPGGEDGLAAKAEAIAEFGLEASYDFPAPQPPRGEMAAYDPELAALPLEVLVEMGEGLVAAVAGLHPDLQVYCQIERQVRERHIANGKGLDTGWRKTMLVAGLAAELVEGRDMLGVGDWAVGTSLAALDLPQLAGNLAADFAAARQIVPVAAGQYPVLFRPGAFSDLVARLMACLDGGAVVRKVSPWAGRLGEQVLAPALSVVDDGLLAGGPGSGLYDDQGVACGRTVLIDGGRLSEYLLDLDSAARLGRTPTGTGGIERPRPNNLLVLPGEQSWRELLAGIGRGLLIDQAMGAWAGNPYGGQVTGNIALGFLVEDGRIVGRVKDCMFAVNALTHLRDNLAGLSREVKCLGGGSLPWALINEVSIATGQGG